jgi:uncharacterized protein YkwD
MNKRSISIIRRSFAGAAALAISLGIAGRVHGDASDLVWKTATESPRAAAPTDRPDPLITACGAPDAALAEVAARSVRRQIDGANLPGPDELAFSLRASGDPHVWPRAWSIAGQALDEEDTARRVKSWIATWNTLGTRRCGVARKRGPDGTTVIAAVAVDALADMSPLPVSARVGQWLSLDGTMLVATSAAKVVLLGPRGAPKSIVASLADRRVHATFSVDQPGPWLVQVLATVATGPRPVLEAMVFAGIAPQTQFIPTSVPGEAESKGAKDDDDAMLRMINAARASEQLAPLTRDASLDKLAKAHSEEMKKARMVGHDIGGGDPTVRLKAAGILARVAGENCASASSPENAHRALWASPSHRGNLLLGQFTKVGVAVVRSADGTVWVTEIFAG